MIDNRGVMLPDGHIMFCDDGDVAAVVAMRPRACKARPNKHVSSVVYAQSGRRFSSILVHRLLARPGPDEVVDHINSDGLDNRRANLRVCSPSQNAAAARSKGSKWGFRGVAKSGHEKTWFSQIRCRGKNHYLGRFPTPEAAARAYDAKALELFGPFARPNFPG